MHDGQHVGGLDEVQVEQVGLEVRAGHFHDVGRQRDPLGRGQVGGKDPGRMRRRAIVIRAGLRPDVADNVGGRREPCGDGASE